MTDDIVTRLREHRDDEKQLGNDLLAEVLRDAADEIERLRKSIEFWRNMADGLWETMDSNNHEEGCVWFIEQPCNCVVKNYLEAVRGE